ncbi:MAG: hypothetical protein QXD03_01940 [Candidatus Anstonellales archaeon]
MLVSNDEFLKIIEEGKHSSLLNLYDKRTSSAVIKHPRNISIIIQDTYNNPFFPIPRPRLDSSDFDTMYVYNYFRSYYSSFKLMMLPWHYLIEFCEFKYIAINTRPLDMRFPLESSYVIENVSLTEDEKDIFSKIDISDSIHICIVGDTNRDIYPSDFYKTIRNFCIVPIMRMFKVNKTRENLIYFLRIGKNINRKNIVRF